MSEIKGWKLVPIEPTEEMLVAGAGPGESFKLLSMAIYTAMIEKAPEPSASVGMGSVAEHDASRHAELLEIHKIAMCIAECPPATDSDTVTVRMVKEMAYRLNQALARDKEVRAKALEDAAQHLEEFPIRVVGNSAATQNDCVDELLRMAAELREEK